MKKLTIEISDEAHLELLKIQLEKRVAEGAKKTLAIVASEVFETLVKEKAAK